MRCNVPAVTYFGLRDYGTAQWEGGQPDCQHIQMEVGMSDKNTLGPTGYLPPSNAANVGRKLQYRSVCGKCGATRVDAQIGLEQTPAEYVDTLVQVFREIRRVLRKDGTVWLNLGDSYAGSGSATGGDFKQTNTGSGGRWAGGPASTQKRHHPPSGLKPKDLIGIPWRVAFALQADGWWLRSEIIWAKPNCMPESVTDRPTRSHEYIFLLTKAERYYYDADAIRENWTDERNGASGAKSLPYSVGAGRHDTLGAPGKPGLGVTPSVPGRNKRTVWTVATQPLSEAHFATFPERLIEPCVLAGTSPQACEHCGAPWERVVENTPEYIALKESRGRWGHENGDDLTEFGRRKRGGGGAASGGELAALGQTRITTGWQPTCRCDNEGTGLCVVLDPFAGSGTTLRVAAKHRRSAIGIELNADYISIADKRTNGVQTMMDLPA